MTYQENIKRIINAKSYSEVVQDNTCNGICSKCGECCGNTMSILYRKYRKRLCYI